MLIDTTNIKTVLKAREQLLNKPSNTLLADAATAFFRDYNRLYRITDKWDTQQRIKHLMGRIDKHYKAYLKLQEAAKDNPNDEIERQQKLAKVAFLVYGLFCVYGKMNKVWQNRTNSKKKPNPLYEEMACPIGGKIYQFCGEPAKADKYNCVVASSHAHQAIQLVVEDCPSVLRKKNKIADLVGADVALSVIISEFSRIQRFDLDSFDPFSDYVKNWQSMGVYCQFLQEYDFNERKSYVLFAVSDTLTNYEETYREAMEVFLYVFFSPNSAYIEAVSNGLSTGEITQIQGVLLDANAAPALDPLTIMQQAELPISETDKALESLEKIKTKRDISEELTEYGYHRGFKYAKLERPQVWNMITPPDDAESLNSKK